MKKTHILGIIVIAIAIGVILSMVTDAATYADFKTAEKAAGEQFQVVGELNKDKLIAYSPQTNANQFSFFMIDQSGTEKKVVFNGAKPQDFERSEQVVITGSFNGEDFHADKILMKCPSKYQDGSNQGLTEITAKQ